MADARAELGLSDDVFPAGAAAETTEEPAAETAEEPPEA